MAKLGRNDPCPCGSGRKYKKCCSPKFDAPSPQPSPGAQSSPEGSQWLSNVGDGGDPDIIAAAHWPIVKAWVPVPEAWAVTGVGVAAIARQSPSGEWAYAGFGLELNRRGIKAVFGEGRCTPAAAEKFIDEMVESVGGCQPGDAEAVASLVRACAAYSEDFGTFPPSTAAFFGMLPRQAKAATLASLSGRWGQHPAALVDLVTAHASLPLPDEHAENAVLTSVTFALSDAPAAISALRALHPDFDLVEEGPRTTFEYTRPSKAGQRSPLSRIEGRRVQGKAIIEGHHITLITGALSMSARQIRCALDAISPRPRLEAATWYSPTLDREWSWSAAEEPLAMHGTAFDAG